MEFAFGIKLQLKCNNCVRKQLCNCSPGSVVTAGLHLHWNPLLFEHVVSGHLLAVPSGWLIRNPSSRWLRANAPVFPPESFSFLSTLHHISAYYERPHTPVRGDLQCSLMSLLPGCDSGCHSFFHHVLKCQPLCSAR